MRNKQPETIYLKDYKSVPVQIDSLDLPFNLGEDQTVVTLSLTMSVPDHGELCLAG